MRQRAGMLSFIKPPQLIKEKTISGKTIITYVFLIMGIEMHNVQNLKSF